MSSIIWQDLHHNQLTVKQLYSILQLRSEVFIVGQQLMYQDADGNDLLGNNRHIMAWQNDHLIAYARILMDDPNLLSIGRVCVAPTARKMGLGAKTMRLAIDSCKHYNPSATVKVSAQLHVKDFYNSLGFTSEGEIYYEAGIAHIKMLKTSLNPM